MTVPLRWRVGRLFLLGVALGIVGTVVLRSPAAPVYPPVATSAPSAREELMADPFVEYTEADLSGGAVRVYFVPGDGRLLIVFDDVEAPAEGTRLNVAVLCADDPIELGMLARRFYGDSSSASESNSLYYTGAEECSAVVLTATSVERVTGATLTIRIGPGPVDLLHWEWA